MVEIAAKSKTELVLMGPFRDQVLFDDLKNSKNWSWVSYLGNLDRRTVEYVYSRCNLGFVILHPDENYINSLPIKLFEYMINGLVVLSSNFPEWKKIITDSGAGYCIDPFDVETSVDIINNLKSKPSLELELTKNGIDAAMGKYRWASEAEKLYLIYN